MNESKTVHVTLPDGSPVEATMHRQTGWDQLTRDRLVRKLREADPEIDIDRDPVYFHHATSWAEVMAQMDALEGLDYARPAPSDPPAAVLAAFQAWMGLDGPFVWACRRAVIELNEPPGERALLPPEKLPEAERADPLPTSSA